jgi:DNA invertase Pin-like site-specific DNA recombinase
VFEAGFAGERAGFERKFIRAAPARGTPRAVVRGVRKGRRPKLTDHQKREAINGREYGEAITM